MLVRGNLLRVPPTLDDPKQTLENLFRMISNIGLPKPTPLINFPVSRILKCRDVQEASLFLDEQDPLDRDGGVRVDDVGIVLEVRNEER